MKWLIRALLVALVGGASLIALESAFRADAAPAGAGRDEAASASAFKAIVPVLRHPRCMNCHST